MRLTKGSPEAIEWGKRMKALRNRGSSNLKQKADNYESDSKVETKEEIESTAATEPKKKQRAARFPKGSTEAKEHMAKLRSLKKRHQ
jgi:hypothetical protein